MLDTLALGGKAAPTVQLIDGAVQGLVRFAKICGHEIGVVEVSQRRIGISSAGGEDGVGVGREALQSFCRDGGQREGIVHEADPVAKSRLSSRPPMKRSQLTCAWQK